MTAAVCCDPSCATAVGRGGGVYSDLGGESDIVKFSRMVMVMAMVLALCVKGKTPRRKFKKGLKGLTGENIKRTLSCNRNAVSPTPNFCSLAKDPTLASRNGASRRKPCTTPMLVKKAAIGG